jgi:carboxymethylenebutenolidase
MKLQEIARVTGKRERARLWERILLAVAVVGLFACAGARATEKPKTATVQFKSGDQTLSGFLALPDKEGKHPAMIVIHESWGLNDWVKEQAEKLAEQGYVSLAVDLYGGKIATDPAEAHELMRALPEAGAIKDLRAAFDYLATRPDVKPDNIGVIGWGTGGGLAMQLAPHEPRLKACVVNYGALPTDPGDLQNIGAAILGNFGALDRGITPDDVKAFQVSMTKLQKFISLKIYDNAGHGFENPNNAEAYRPEAAADAWKRTLTFLKAVVK